jgi:Protein of unknown function (DUF4232)
VLTVAGRSTFLRYVPTRRRKHLGAVLMLACGLTLGACGSHVTVTGGFKPSTAGAAGSSGGGGGAKPAATGSQPGSPGVAMCQTSQLKIAMGRTGAVAGIFGGDLLFTNQGSAACIVNGWPAVVGVTSGGQTVTATQVHTTQFGPFSADVQSVTLSPGATAEVAFSAAASGCSQSFKTLRVSAPGDTQYQEISGWLPQLRSYVPDCSPMSISPLVPNATLPDPAQQP